LLTDDICASWASAGSWVLLIGRGDRPLLERAEQLGLGPQTILWRDELPRNRSGLLRLRGLAPHDHAAIVSADWSLELNPQLYKLALRLTPARQRWLIDLARDQPPRPLRASELNRGIVALPVTVAAGACEGAAAVAVAATLRRRRRSYGAARRIVGVWMNHGSAPVGGAVTHVGGILRGFAKEGFDTALVTTDPIPSALREEVGEHHLAAPLPARNRVTSDLHAMAVNRTLAAELQRVASTARPAFIYQRHFPFITAGLRVARRSGLPLVLEFNNSEVWARENWNAPSRPERLLDPLLRWSEQTVVKHADLVVAVSDQAASMAREAGARHERVVVVPNGVDIEAIDRLRANAVRSTQGGPIVGWIGSFGVWHGAEVLVEALVHLPDNVTALLIGDGGTRPACVALAKRLGVAERIEWTGALPHADAVARLAGCDLLASPHVPFRERRFFGSPTKLFEFMALGLPIVASRLEQLEEVLDDGRTAVLVAPGDPAALAHGIATVLGDRQLASRLASGARREAEARHDWVMRARQITGRLVEAGVL
jgi:glycosyltransferase involved in cell wall biosynthesis